MNSKLEEKLIQYEKSTPVTNDAELMCALEDIINAEELRPAEERDYDLLDEAIDALLTLQGEDTESLEAHAEEYTAKHMAELGKKNAQQPVKLVLRAFKLKRLIPIVAAISMIFMTTIVSYTTGYDWFSDVYNRVKSTFSENERAVAAGDYYEFSTLEDLCDIPECEEMLLPWSLPSGYSYKRISAQKVFVKIADNSFKDYTVIDITTTGENSWQGISVEPSIVAHDAEGKNLHLGGIDIIYYKNAERHYGVFEMGESTYTVSAISISELKRMLDSLQPSNVALSTERSKEELPETPEVQSTMTSEDHAVSSEAITGFVVKGQKYDYKDGNVMILDVENNTSKNYTLTVTGVCKDANGEVLKTMKKIYDGFPAGWSNYFVFNPGIEFDSFSFEVATEEYEGKTFSKDFNVRQAKPKIDMVPAFSDGNGQFYIWNETGSLVLYTSVLANMYPVINGNEGFVKYKCDFVLLDSLGDVYIVDSLGSSNVSSGADGNAIPLFSTSYLWEDKDEYVLPEELENITGILAVKYVEKSQYYNGK